MERFSDDSLEQWVTDLKWASDDAKVRSLLQDVFYRRLRFSHLQARLWKRTIDLFWRCGWSLREIGDKFGVDRQNVWRIVASLRREAQRYFGDGQELQSLHGGQEPQPKPKDEKPKPPAIQPDTENENPEHWAAVLENHGLGDADVRMSRLFNRGPVYKFSWRSGASVHAESWPEFYEHETEPKPCLRVQKTTRQARRIGTKSVEINGAIFEVAVFSSGVGNTRLARRRPAAGAYRWWPNPKHKQASPNREYDPEETRGILAHVATAKDVEAAIDGDQEALGFLAQYNEIRDSKSDPLRDAWSNPPKSWQPRNPRPVLLAERQECVRCKRKSMAVLIDMDNAIHQRCEGKSCTYMAVWKPTQIKHEQEQIGRGRPRKPVTPAFVFSGRGLTETSGQSGVQSGERTEMRNTMNHKQATAIIKETDVPRSTIARLAGLHLSDLSSWLNGNLDFSQDKIERVSQAVADVAKMVQAMGTLGIKVDLADVDNVRYLVKKINDAERQLDLPLDAPVEEPPLRMKPIEASGTAAD